MKNTLAGINKTSSLENFTFLSQYAEFYIFITTSFSYDKELV